MTGGSVNARITALQRRQRERTEPGGASTAWNHKDNRTEGDVLEGWVMEVEERDTKRGVKQTVLIVDDIVTGELEELWIWHAGLQAQVKEQGGAAEGDYISVRWWGVPEGWASFGYSVELEKLSEPDPQQQDLPIEPQPAGTPDAAAATTPTN